MKVIPLHCLKCSRERDGEPFLCFRHVRVSSPYLFHCQHVCPTTTSITHCDLHCLMALTPMLHPSHSHSLLSE